LVLETFSFEYLEYLLQIKIASNVKYTHESIFVVFVIHW